MKSRFTKNLTTRWLNTLLLCAILFLTAACITITEPIEGPSPLEPLLPTVTSEESALNIVRATRTPSAPLARTSRATMGNVPATERATSVAISTTTTTPGTPTSSPTATLVPNYYEVVEGDTLSVIAKKYAISVEALRVANSLTDADVLSIGQIIIIPSASEIVQVVAQQGTPIPTPQTESGDLIHYIQVGETLSGIAAQYGIARDDLLMANGLRPDALLVAGNTLLIPQGEYVPIPTATAVPPTQVPTMQVALEPSATPTASPPASPTVTPTPAPTIYIVQEGDYGRLIASSHGITLEELKAANPGVVLETLSVGQQLILPPATSSSSASPTPTAATLAPTATPTAVPPVIVTHVVTQGESYASLAEQYGVPEESIRAQNPSITDTLPVNSSLDIPLGTATPTPEPTLPPTATATPAPEYLAPILLLPANGSTWTYTAGDTPLQLVWTSTGILKENEFYVVRLRALDPDTGELEWSETHWTKNPSWRLEAPLLERIVDTVKLRWDVMVMRRTSSGDTAPPSGIGLSEKSQTFELIFVRQ